MRTLWLDSARRARLERNIVASCSRIKRVNSREHRVDINTTPTLGIIHGRIVRHHGSSVLIPLQMAQELWGNRTALACLS